MSRRLPGGCPFTSGFDKSIICRFDVLVANSSLLSKGGCIFLPLDLLEFSHWTISYLTRSMGFFTVFSLPLPPQSFLSFRFRLKQQPLNLIALSSVNQVFASISKCLGPRSSCANTGWILFPKVSTTHNFAFLRSALQKLSLA